MSYIFGGDTGMSYDDIQRKRKVVEALRLKQAGAAPKSVGEGLNAIGQALLARSMEKKADAADKENRAEFDKKWEIALGLTGGIGAGENEFSPFVGGATGSAESPEYNIDEGDPRRGTFATGASQTSSLYNDLERQYGLPSGYLARTAHIESGGNPNAQNPNSSAGGAFQFIDSTARQYGLTDKTNLAASADAAARLARDNAQVLRRTLGREPTAAELYLAHQQGAGGAAKMLANPNAPATSVVGGDAVNLNGGNAGMTAGQFAGQWLNKFNGGAAMNHSNAIQLASLAQDPYASDQQRMIAGMLLQQAQQANDPLRQMQIERERLQLEQLRNPQAPQMTPYQQAQIELSQERLNLDRVKQSGGVAGTEYGLNPQFGVDADGNPVMLQVGKDGTATQTQMPDGISLSREPIKIDAGTHFVLLDPITRQPVGQIEKDLAGEAEAKAQGAAQGKASADAAISAPNVIAQADEMIGLIDSIIADPALPGITGMMQGRLPPMTQAGTDLNVKIEQLQGKAFLQAFESLKGGGQITEREGIAAQNAMARLQRAQSTESYISALNELRGIVDSGRRRAAGEDNQAQTSGANPFLNMSEADFSKIDISKLSPEEMEMLAKARGLR